MKLIPTAVSRGVARQGLQMQKNSPTILFGVGVVGMVASTVLACRSTLKLEKVVLDVQNDLDTAKTMVHDDYSEQDRRKDIALIWTRGALEVTKLYGPAVLVGSLSIAALTKSHNILNERNAALAAAYAAVDKAFEKYRERVVDKYGEDEDRYLRYGTEEVVVIDDDGKETKELRVAPGDPSMYARFFDEYSTQWSKEPEYNMVFLRCQQNWANDILKVRGHLFLNEVYQALGLSHTKAGAVVGWVMGDGDNYIDFGLYDNTDNVRNFVNGREGAILLDFNVDGVIYDKIENHGEKLSWQQ